MASLTRLKLMEVDPTPANLPPITGLVDRLKNLQSELEFLYDPHDADSDSACDKRHRPLRFLLRVA
jgi:hypothetical protein